MGPRPFHETLSKASSALSILATKTDRKGGDYVQAFPVSIGADPRFSPPNKQRGTVTAQKHNFSGRTQCEKSTCYWHHRTGRLLPGGATVGKRLRGSRHHTSLLNIQY